MTWVAIGPPWPLSLVWIWSISSFLIVLEGGGYGPVC